jgi:hypothetical protein
MNTTKNLLTLLLDFAEKEEKNVELFETILKETQIFKKLDEDYLKKMSKKKEWLKKNSVWKKKVKTAGEEDSDKSDSETDSDKSDSDSDSSKSSESESSESEKEDEEELPKWNKKIKTSTTILSKSDRIIEFTHGSGYNCK